MSSRSSKYCLNLSIVMNEPDDMSLNRDEALNWAFRDSFCLMFQNAVSASTSSQKNAASWSSLGLFIIRFLQMSNNKGSKYEQPSYRKPHYNDDKYYGQRKVQESSTRYDDPYTSKSPHRDQRGRDSKQTKQPAPYPKSQTYKRDEYRMEGPREYYDQRRYEERRPVRKERPRSRERSKEYGGQYRRSREKKRQRSNQRSEDRRKSRSYSSSPRSRRRRSKSVSSRSYSDSRSRSRSYKRRRSRSSEKSSSHRRYDYYNRYPREDSRDRKDRYRPQYYAKKDVRDGREMRQRQQIRVQLRQDYEPRSRSPKDYYSGRDYYPKIEVKVEKGDYKARQPARKNPQKQPNKPQNSYPKQTQKKSSKAPDPKPFWPFQVVEQQKPIKIQIDKPEKQNTNEDSSSLPKKKEKQPQLPSIDVSRQVQPPKQVNELDELIKATQKILKFELPQNSFLIAQSYRRMDDIEFEGALPEWKSRLEDGKSNINLLRCQWISQASNKNTQKIEESDRLIPPRHFKLQRPQYENTQFEIKLQELSEEIRHKSRIISQAMRKIVGIEADIDILKSQKVK